MRMVSLKHNIRVRGFWGKKLICARVTLVLQSAANLNKKQSIGLYNVRSEKMLGRENGH